VAQHGKSVLIVDDDLDVLEVMSNVLADAGFDVAQAAGGMEAMSTIVAGKGFDLLLTDVRMPVRSTGSLSRAPPDDIFPILPSSMSAAGSRSCRTPSTCSDRCSPSPCHLPRCAGPWSRSCGRHEPASHSFPPNSVEGKMAAMRL
jgi:hypothetical protein